MGFSFAETDDVEDLLNCLRIYNVKKSINKLLKGKFLLLAKNATHFLKIQTGLDILSIRRRSPSLNSSSTSCQMAENSSRLTSSPGTIRMTQLTFPPVEKISNKYSKVQALLLKM